MASAADRRIFWTASVVVVALDVVTKLIAEATLLLTPGIPVIGDWFQLRLVYNRGAAFGLHVGPYSRWVFFAVAVIAVLVLNRMSVQTSAGDRFRLLVTAGPVSVPQVFETPAPLSMAVLTRAQRSWSSSRRGKKVRVKSV